MDEHYGWRRWRKPIARLRLWSGTEDVTRLFAWEEHGDSLRLSGPYALLTRYTVDEAARVGHPIDGGQLARDEADSLARRCDFFVELPNYSVVISEWCPTVNNS